MKRKINISTIVAVVLVAMTVLTACGDRRPKSTSTRGLARIMCDESFQSVLEQEIAVFEYKYPEASIMPEYINEHDALDSLFKNKVDLIIISHDLTADQKKSLMGAKEGMEKWYLGKYGQKGAEWLAKYKKSVEEASK